MAAVITSQTDWGSTERPEDAPRIGERDRSDEFAVVFDKNPPMMSGQRGHHILVFELPSDEVFGTVELDAAMGADLTDPGDPATGNGQRRLAFSIEVRVEREAVRPMTEVGLEPIPENAREAGSMLVRRKTPAGLTEVIVIQEALAGPPQGPKIRTAMPKDPCLPGVIEALHSGVPARLSRRDE